MATYSWAFSGKIILSSLSFNTLANCFLNSDKKYKGPPRNATFPSIFLPQDNTLTVWTTTALKILIAISALLAPSFIRGCMSVFANTPHLDAIGYTTLKSLANSLRPLASVFKRDAIWSIKAPVPPAQIPFILWSIPPDKKVTLASSPPSSITTSVSGLYSSIDLVLDITSCSNLIPIFLDRPIPPEPVITDFTLIFPNLLKISFNWSLTAFLTSEKCLLYSLYSIDLSSDKITALTVVDPTSMPKL